MPTKADGTDILLLAKAMELVPLENAHFFYLVNKLMINKTQNIFYLAVNKIIGFFVFNGISTFVGYLMLKPFS